MIQQLLSSLPEETAEELLAALMDSTSPGRREAAVLAVLRQAGQEWKDSVGTWVAELLCVDLLVPEPYKHWRPMVRKAMAFVAAHISNERLAPKIIEQLDLPPETSAEVRLGLIITRTPGLQKLGQVLARARKLSPSLRLELQKLENGISDVTPDQVREIVRRELGHSLEVYNVKLATTLLSEASVSAILEFHWDNPHTGKCETGVFKVIKPHVPSCYAEDLLLLKSLAEFLAGHATEFGVVSREVVETLEEVRLLLEREVDFRGEQVTLAEIQRVYRWTTTRAPRLIPQLCSDIITAMSVERGVKVTEALRNRSIIARRRIASQIVESVLAAPIFSPEPQAIFHADPHAGNMLYDESRQELILLDWALTGRLSLGDRRQLARLIIMASFRDSAGVRDAIYALNAGVAAPADFSRKVIDRCVKEFFASLPFACSPGAIDAMHLLDRIGAEGVRFPGSLVLIRKVLFTLDGVLYDITGGSIRIDFIVARVFLNRWMGRFGRLPEPFSMADAVALQRSAMRYFTGLWAWPAEPEVRRHALQPGARQ